MTTRGEMVAVQLVSCLYMCSHWRGLVVDGNGQDQARLLIGIPWAVKGDHKRALTNGRPGKPRLIYNKHKELLVELGCFLPRFIFHFFLSLAWAFFLCSSSFLMFVCSSYILFLISSSSCS